MSKSKQPSETIDDRAISQEQASASNSATADKASFNLFLKKLSAVASDDRIRSKLSLYTREEGDEMKISTPWLRLDTGAKGGRDQLPLEQA